MKRISFLILVAVITSFGNGCSSGPSKEEQALSQVNVAVRKEFNDMNFPSDGTIGEKDAWGNNLIWDLEKHWNSYKLKVRSSGPDGLPYTKDDITATTPVKVTDEESASERFVRGLARGTFKGIKQGIFGQKDTEKDKKDNGKDKK